MYNNCEYCDKMRNGILFAEKNNLRTVAELKLIWVAHLRECHGLPQHPDPNREALRQAFGVLGEV